MVYTVRIEPDPGDETRHAEQSTYQKQQMRAIKRSNFISAIAAGIAGATLASLIIYACITYGQLKEMRKATKATASATNIAAKQLDVSERPWIQFDITPNGQIVKDSFGISTTVKITGRNSGNSPAIRARMSTEMKVFAMNVLDAEIRRERDKFCNEVQASTGGETVFPGTASFPNSLHIGATQKDIDTVSARGSLYNPVIVGCVVYQSTFDETIHRTGQAFIVIVSGTNGYGVSVSKEKGIIAPSNFILTPAIPIDAN